MLELKTKVICEKKDHLQMAKNAQIILTTNEIGVALLDDQSKLVNIPLNEPVLMSSFNVDEPEKAVKKHINLFAFLIHQSILIGLLV